MSLTYPHETPPPPGQTITLAPGVLWHRMPLPFALNHINLWLLEDGAGWTAVDTGISRPEVQEAWRQVLADSGGGRPLARQIVTHCHPDHLGLAWWLEKEYGAQLWMTAGEYMAGNVLRADLGGFSGTFLVEMFRRHGLAGQAFDVSGRRGNRYAQGVPDVPLTYRRMFEGDRIGVGEHEWRVIIGYGHSVEHAALYCESLGVLISGDMLLPRISTNVPVWACSPEDDVLTCFLASIDRFRELPDDTLVLPSHGLPFRGIEARVVALHAHHAARCEDLLAACTEPKSAAELLPVLFQRDITDAHQIRFAMSEAIAHLNYLERQGRLRRVEEGGVLRWHAPDERRLG